jgi:hypothetical protein
MCGNGKNQMERKETNNNKKNPSALSNDASFYQ